MHVRCYAGHAFAPYARGLWSGLTEWIIVRMAHKRKLANRLSYSEHWINILPIIYAYNAGISWLRSYAWLQLHARLRPYTWFRSYVPTLVTFPTPVDLTTLDVSSDSGHPSRLRSMSSPLALPPQLWKTSHGRARWLQLFTAQTLSQK
jgi:hypothetical protein